MIKYINNLFLTEKTEKRLDKIKSDIESKKYISRSCIITLASCEDDVFDIIPLYNLKFRNIEDEDILVLGIAESKAQAMNICAQLSEDYILSKADISMRQYYEKFI